jgi:hypothetical protein
MKAGRRFGRTLSTIQVLGAEAGWILKKAWRKLSVCLAFGREGRNCRRDADNNTRDACATHEAGLERNLPRLLYNHADLQRPFSTAETLAEGWLWSNENVKVVKGGELTRRVFGKAD